jgi:hypothetical protein
MEGTVISVIPAIVLASGVTTPPGSNCTNVILRYESGEVQSIRYLDTALRFLMQEAVRRALFRVAYAAIISRGMRSVPMLKVLVRALRLPSPEIVRRHRHIAQRILSDAFKKYA